VVLDHRLERGGYGLKALGWGFHVVAHVLAHLFGLGQPDLWVVLGGREFWGYMGYMGFKGFKGSIGTGIVKGFGIMEGNRALVAGLWVPPSV
jgi:hypothetical protein